MAQRPQRDQFETEQEFIDAINRWEASQNNPNEEPTEPINWGKILPWILGALLLVFLLFFMFNRSSANAEKQALKEQVEQAEAKAREAEDRANAKVAPAPTIILPVWETENDDSDALLNGQERTIGTDPSIPDWDGDGDDDGEEVGDYSKLRDMDGDGYLDLPDEDGDGIADVFESSIEDADGDGSPDQFDPCNNDFHNRCARVKVCCNGTKVVEYNPKPKQVASNDCTFVCGDCHVTVRCGKHQCSKSKPAYYNPKRENPSNNSPCNANLVKNGPPPKGYSSWCNYWEQHYPDKITWLSADKQGCTDICGNSHRDAGKGDGRGSAKKMVSLDDEDY